MSSREPVRVSEKYTLSITEAAEYFGIGQGTLRRLVSNNPYEDWILKVGRHTRIKRAAFEKYMDRSADL